MKIDLNYKMRDIETGEPMRDPEVMVDENKNPVRDKFGNLQMKLGPVITMKKICIRALKSMHEEEIDPRTGRSRALTESEKEKRGELLEKISKMDGLVELNNEEVSLLQKVIGSYGSVMVVRQANKILDPVKYPEIEIPKDKKKK